MSQQIKNSCSRDNYFSSRLPHFFIYFYFLSGVSLLIFLLWQDAPWRSNQVILNSLTNLSALQCSWRCLGDKVSGFFFESGYKLIFISFLIFIFIRAFWRAAKAIIKTNLSRRTLEAMASTRNIWGIDYYSVHFPGPLAFTLGWFKPKIFISDFLEAHLNEEELKIVLLHEGCHQRKKDPGRGLLINFLSDLLFFLPLTERISTALHLCREVEADISSLSSSESLSPFISTLNKMRRFPLPQENKVIKKLFSEANDKDLARLLYLGEGRLGSLFSWRKFALSLGLSVSLIFLSLNSFFPRQREAFLEHHITCPVHNSTGMNNFIYIDKKTNHHFNSRREDHG
jgi:Zn-dependent protease with chaperone function